MKLLFKNIITRWTERNKIFTWYHKDGKTEKLKRSQITYTSLTGWYKRV